MVISDYQVSSVELHRTDCVLIYQKHLYINYWDVVGSSWNRSRDLKERNQNWCAPSLGVEHPRLGTHRPKRKCKKQKERERLQGRNIVFCRPLQDPEHKRTGVWLSKAGVTRNFQSDSHHSYSEVPFFKVLFRLEKMLSDGEGFINAYPSAHRPTGGSRRRRQSTEFIDEGRRHRSRLTADAFMYLDNAQVRNPNEGVNRFKNMLKTYNNTDSSTPGDTTPSFSSSRPSLRFC